MINTNSEINKVVLAYSGGLDTSVILKWLQDTYNCEVVTFTADIGQGEEVQPAKQKAEMLGVKEIFIDDLKEEFVRDFVFPMLRGNAFYEGNYLLGTSIARPLIAKEQIRIAKKCGADGVSHGATGKGNDQVRFELAYIDLNPDIKIIAPWREWDLTSRSVLMDYARDHDIPIPVSKDKPYSMDRNLFHMSYEGGNLEDPWVEPDEGMFMLSVSPESAPDKVTTIEIDYEEGNPISINGERMSPATLLAKLNEYGGKNGIGRVDIVENRFVGMKSRGVYETPGGTILHVAHRAVESITMDREVMFLRDSLIPSYAKMIYNGFWYSPERILLQKTIDESQKTVTGIARLKLYKGNCTVEGRKSINSLYDQNVVTFEEGDGYRQDDADGFIRLNALRLKMYSKVYDSKVDKNK